MSKKKNYKHKKDQNKDKRAVASSNQNFSTLNQVAGVPEKSKFHSTQKLVEPKHIVEPHTLCPLCGKPIECIAEAMVNENNEYVHFDCALNLVKEKTNLGSNQSISYIGSGNFAVVEKNEEGKYIIINRIPFEKSEQTNILRSFIDEVKR